MPTYTYTIFDSDPDASGDGWPSHSDVTIEADTDSEAINEVRETLEIEAVGLDAEEAGQRIYALIWLPDGTTEKISHRIEDSDNA